MMLTKKQQIKSITEIKDSTEPEVQNVEVPGLAKNKQIEALSDPLPDLETVWEKWFESSNLWLQSLLRTLRMLTALFTSFVDPSPDA